MNIDTVRNLVAVINSVNGVLRDAIESIDGIGISEAEESELTAYEILTDEISQSLADHVPADVYPVE